MDKYRRDLKKQVRDCINLGYIVPEDIPSIELYMDQITTFMDKYLSKNKRTEEDKTLTKTMINNYTKNDLLPPSNKKRYSKEHIILLIYIYYLKNIVSISDIQTILVPLIENYCDNKNQDFSMEDIYEQLFQLEKRQFFNTGESITKTYELINRHLGDCEDEYLKKFFLVSLLGYDIFMRKKLMEQLIDEMKPEQDEENEKAAKKETKSERTVKSEKTARAEKAVKAGKPVKTEKVSKPREQK